MAKKMNLTPFTPAVYPPKKVRGQALYFAYRQDELLLTGETPHLQVPLLENFTTTGLFPLHQHYLGILGTHHCYAIDLSEDTPTPPTMQFLRLRSTIGLLEENLFWLGGRALQIVEWNRTHQYCGRCGIPNKPHAIDRAMICPQCDLHAYPRLSPAIIVLIQRGSEMLLARNHRFPPGRYSILAGFVEAGESLEQALVREVFEEVHIQVKNIRYFSSQPWPFPNSLMLGFTAEYASGEIVIDPDELADAGWFGPDNLPDLPDGISISRCLIDSFLAQAI